VTYQEQRARLRDLLGWITSLGRDALAHLRASDQGARGDGGALLFLFETPEGSLLYQDSSGCWTSIVRDLRPDVAILAAAGRASLDGEPIQGSLVDFVAREVEWLRPKRVFLGHHDDWFPGFSRAVPTGPIRTELRRRTPATDLVETGYLEATPLFPKS
jgi:hypothetical protein